MKEKLTGESNSITNDGIKKTTDVTTAEVSKNSNDILSITKLDHAKNVLSKEQYDVIGEEWILSDGMTIQKLDTLGCNSSPSDIGNNHLPIDVMNLFGGELLANKNMSYMKFVVIGQFFDTEDIKRHGINKIVEMSMAELNEIAFM